jgi:hypothetical protein
MALSRVKSDLIVSLDAVKIEGILPALVGSNLVGVSTGGDQPSRNNLALNFFGDSVRDNMDRLALSQGWVDSFEDDSDVENFSIPMTEFNGTNNYLNRTSGQGVMSGMTDGKECLLSFYYRVNSDATGSNTDQNIFTISGDNHILIRRDGIDGTHKINIYLYSTGNSLVGRYKNSKTITIADGTVHILIAVKMDASAVADRVKIIITTSDGVKHTTMEEINAASDATIGFGDSTPAIGTSSGGLSGSLAPSGIVNASFAQFYFSLEHLDITNNTNYAKFYNTHASPKFFGANGSLPTGNQPVIYLNNPFGSFQNNLGSGGDFNLNGSALIEGLAGYIGDDALYSSESFSNSYGLIDQYIGALQRSTEGFGPGRANDKIYQTFRLASETNITKIGFSCREFGSISGNMTVEIQGHTGTYGVSGTPDNNIHALANFNVDTGNSVQTYSYVTFPEPVYLAAGDYSIVWNCENINADGTQNTYFEMIVDGNFGNPHSGHSGNEGRHTSGSGYAAEVSLNVVFSLNGSKNLDLITKGSYDIGNSPATAPEKGHMEVLMTEQPASATPTWSDTLDTTDFGWHSQTLRQVITASTSGSRIRVTIPIGTSISNGGGYADNISIVKQSGTGPNGTETPTEILYGGASGFTGPKGGSIVSDWIDYEVVAGQTYLLCIDFTSGGGNDSFYHIFTGGEGAFLKGSADSALLQQMPSGYSTLSNRTHVFNKLEVGVDQVVNTDYIAEMSRDGGTTYSPVVLNKIKTNVVGTSKNILGGESDFAGDPSGTNIVGRVRSINKDKITVHGVSVNWS